MTPQHQPNQILTCGQRLTSGSKAPVISFSSVDLPAPLGPTSAMRGVLRRNFCGVFQS